MGGVTQAWSLGLGLMLCFYFLNHLHVVESTSYDVGDEQGWSFNASAWPTGKSFKAGDVLVFKYSPLVHNVVVIDEVNHYNNCITEPSSKLYNSGNDSITLAKGGNYFVCGVPPHCMSMNMKMAVHAA